MLNKLKYFIGSTVGRSYWYNHLRFKRKYHGIAIHPSVSIQQEGNLIFGSNGNINEGSRFIIPTDATLMLGNHCYIGRSVEIGPTGVISIGDNTSIQDRSIVLGDVEIGRYCLISLNVLLSSGRHRYDHSPSLLIQDQDVIAKKDINATNVNDKIIIEDDCWIGINAVIMPGVKIGKGAIIGANAVVTRDIPPFAIAVGAPAKVIKYRLSFAPPRQMDYDNEMDRPYFYSGVEVSEAEKVASDFWKGYFTKPHFQLALNTHLGSQLKLAVKTTGSDIILAYEGQKRIINANTPIVQFDLKENQMVTTNHALLSFVYESHDFNSRLILQKAWVE